MKRIPSHSRKFQGNPYHIFKKFYVGKGRQEDIPFGMAIMANVHVQARGEYYDSGPAPSLS